MCRRDDYPPHDAREEDVNGNKVTNMYLHLKNSREELPIEQPKEDPIKPLTKSGTEEPYIAASVHVYDDTLLQTRVTLGTPTLMIGNAGTTIFFTGESLQRILTVLSVLLVDAENAATKCKVHGDTCRSVWHKNDK